MRTLFTTLILLAISLSSFAGNRYGNSQLNIRLAAFSNYTVVFNNTTYFATEWVKIFNIPPGKHYLKIVETVQSPYGRATGKRLIYQGYITVPAQSRVFSKVGFNRNYDVARIERLGRDYYRPRANDRVNYDRDYGFDYGYNGPADRGRDNNYNDDYDRDDRDDNQGDDGAYDDGTYGASQLQAPKPAAKASDKKVTQQPAKTKK